MIALLSSLLLFLSLTMSAEAAENVPHNLTPAAMQEDTEESDVDANGPQNNAVSEQETPAIAVKVGQISKPTTNNFGILSEGKEGLPEGVWKNDNRERDDFLLSQMRYGIANETMRSLVIKLLTLQSSPPQGNTGDDWFVLRLYALEGLGQDDKVMQMLASVPQSIMTQNMFKLLAELELARADYDKACKQGTVASASADPSNAVYWQKLSIICKLHDGKKDEALVGVDMLRESDAGDTFFQDAVAHIINKNVPLRTLPKTVTLFDFALIRLSGDTEKLKDRIEAIPSLAVKYLALDTSIDEKLREKVVARAEQMGILPAQQNNSLPEQPFSKPLASDVSSLVRSLGNTDKSATSADNAVIARLALDEGGIQDSRRIEKLLSLMQVFGYSIPDTIWEKLFTHHGRYDGDVPPAIYLSWLNEAATSDRKGEVLLLSALIMGTSDADKISDIALIPVIKALKATGFEKEARHIAFSAVKTYH